MIFVALFVVLYLISDLLSRRRERRDRQKYEACGCDACRQWLAAHPEDGGL